MNLDRDHDPDRLVGAWLDEGPRTFSPRLLDRTLAEIHGTRQQRHRPVPWSPPRMNLTFLTGLAGAAVVAVLFAAGAFLPWLPSTFFGPAGSPTPSPLVTPGPRPTPDASGSPVASPIAPTFAAGDVPFEGTTWQLVGRIDGTRREGDPVYISPVGAEPATIRFDPGRFSGSTGCHSIGGTWEATPRKGRTFPADLAVDANMRTNACADDGLAAQDLNVIEELDGAGAIQVTAAGYEVLASDLTDADLDPTLLAHYQSNPALVRLIIRDQSGEGTLIYAPIADPAGEAKGPVLLTSPQPFLETDWRIEAVTDADGGLAAVPLESEAAIRFKQVGDADRFDAYDGCESVQGDWALDPRQGRDGTRTLELVPNDPEVGACNQITLDQARAILSALADVGSVQAIDRAPDAGALGLTRQQLDRRLQRALSANPGASRQLLRDRTGTPILLLVAAAPSDPPVQMSPAPDAQPEFLTGQVPFEGTDWLLVGHARGADSEGPALVSPGVQAWLRFEGEGFLGSSGCFGISGPVWERPDGDAVTPVDLLPIPLNDYGCRSGAAIDEDAAINGLLEQVETFQLTRGGPEMLGSGLAEADLDPALAAHLREHPDVPRMVLADGDGAIVLVYAPVAPGYVVEPPPVRGGDVGLVGPRWGLAGWWTGTEVGFADSTRAQSIRFAPDGTFAGSTGCGTVSGRWGTVVGDTVEVGPWVVDQERLAGTCDTGQPARILELLRSVDPATISVTEDLAAELPESWQGDSADHLLRNATYLLLRDASGQPVLAYWVLAEDEPWASAAPSPSAAPSFLAGVVRFG